MNIQDKKIALVHDFLLYQGGAEETLIEIRKVFPQAPIYTLLQNEKWAKKFFSQAEIYNSFLQRAPGVLRKRYKFLLPFMPSAIEAFDLRDYDVVISSSSAFAKGIVVKAKIPHICYMHAPMRYVWDWQHEYLEEKRLKGKMKLITRFMLNYLRLWDRASAVRPDFLVANSKFTARRIAKYYRREVPVIYPPVRVNRIKPQRENDGYFLTVGRFSAYKRVDLIIKTFSKLKLPLVIVGKGEEGARLKKMVEGEPRIKILGWQPNEKLFALYQNARAFVVASEDDFNLTAVEAMAAGKPVIALRAGGLRETIIEGATGEFFDEPILELVADGVRRFIEKESGYDYKEIRRHAEQFSAARFRREFQGYVKSVLRDWNA